MRVLWLCAEPLPRESTAATSGFWATALAEALSRHPAVDLLTASPGRTSGFDPRGTGTFRLPRSRGGSQLPDSTVRDIRQLLAVAQPDLIHVHGTETMLGQIVEHTRIPVVVSLQGFISECCDAVLGGIPVSTWRRFRSVRERLSGGGFLGLHDRWLKSSPGEIRVLAGNRHFIGRTDFDHQVLRKHNPTARYYRGREMLRDGFHAGAWQHAGCTPHRIYCPGFPNPLKGFHILLDAVAELTRDFPDVRIATPGEITRRTRSGLVGNGYHRYLHARIMRLGLERHVEFLGHLDGSAVQRELLAANVYVCPSLVENSSNALGESLVVGCPAVIPTPCGGLQSLVGSTDVVCSFTQGEARSLAAGLRGLFTDGNRAGALSAAAQRRGRELHDPTGIPADYVDIYEQVLNA